jgi:hypothetical protein
MRIFRPPFVAVCLLLMAAAPATQPSSKLVARAHRVLDTLKSSSYQHVTDIDEAAGEFHCDCSGLVSWLLKKELPAHYAAVPFPQRYKHPRAVEFCRFFENAPPDEKAGAPWRRIAKIADARPGDVIAWRKDPLPETGTTGHIVLVDAEPKLAAEGVYEIVVIDSTTRGHKDDTRKADETGVGRGTIFLRVDGEGRPVGYAPRTAAGPFAMYPIGIGRPVVK